MVMVTMGDGQKLWVEEWMMMMMMMMLLTVLLG